MTPGRRQLPRARRLRCLLLVVGVGVVLSATAATRAAEPVDLSDGDAAIAAGKQALGAEYSAPWYDGQADDYKPINLPPVRRRNWSWGDWSSLGEALKFLLWLLLAALVVGIIVALLKNFRRAEQQEVDASSENAAGDRIARVEALPVALERRVTDLLGEARGRAAAGDYATAVVYLFSHQLVEADHAEALRLVKGKTNRQYLRELRRNRPQRPELVAILERTTLLFERAFFGAHPPTEQQFDACLRDSERFVTLLRPTTEESV